MSAFLTIIIFYCLLFLERVSEKQLTFENLDAGFTAVSRSLKRLRYEIHDREISFAAIETRIDELSKKVDEKITYLKSKGEQGVKKNDIRITPGADKIQASLDSLISSPNKPSFEDLKRLLDEIEKIWNEDIQPTFQRGYE